MKAIDQRTLSRIVQKLKAEGRMPAAGKLAAALAAGRAEAVRTAVKLARPDDSDPYNAIFVSSSERDNSTIPQAKAGLESPAFHKLVTLAHSLPAANGGQSGIGYWKDGAEESRIVKLRDARPLSYAAARLGKAFNQKSVLLFREGADGHDVAHVLVVPETNADKIHNDMLARGIEYKTVVPHPTDSGKSVVHTIDFAGGATPDIEAYARDAHAEHYKHLGTAELIGADSRDEAHRIYDRVLAETAHHGNQQHQPSAT